MSKPFEFKDIIKGDIVHLSNGKGVVVEKTIVSDRGDKYIVSEMSVCIYDLTESQLHITKVQRFNRDIGRLQDLTEVGYTLYALRVVEEKFNPYIHYVANRGFSRWELSSRPKLYSKYGAEMFLAKQPYAEEVVLEPIPQLVHRELGVADKISNQNKKSLTAQWRLLGFDLEIQDEAFLIESVHTSILCHMDGVEIFNRQEDEGTVDLTFNEIELIVKTQDILEEAMRGGREYAHTRYEG